MPVLVGERPAPVWQRVAAALMLVVALPSEARRLVAEEHVTIELEGANLAASEPTLKV